jgi:flagellar biosynthetic protein FliR
MAVQMGLSGAVLDPQSEQATAPLAQFTHLFAAALLLSLNAHQVMLDALAASTRAVPVGAPVDARAGAGAALALGGSLFALGLRFAAPVIAAVLIANVALVVLGRAAPTINVLAVAFPVQVLVGLAALAAALPLIGAWLAGWPGSYDGTLTPMLGALARGR